MHVHLVFLTKYRRGVSTKAIPEDLQRIFARVCVDFEAKRVEFDGEDDHVHLRVEYPPKVTVSKRVNSLKGVSSLHIRKNTIPAFKKKLWGKALGSPSDFAGRCGGAPIEVIRQSIKQQQTPSQQSGHDRVRAIHPRPKRRGFSRIKVKMLRSRSMASPSKPFIDTWRAKSYEHAFY